MKPNYSRYSLHCPQKQGDWSLLCESWFVALFPRQESLLWGGLSYHRPQVGGRVKGAVCQIGFKVGQVRLEFIHGIRLHDALGILQGDLLSKRFVVIETVDDTERPEIEALIREAATLDPTQW